MAMTFTKKLFFICKFLPVILLTGCINKGVSSKKIKDMDYTEADTAQKRYAESNLLELRIQALERMLALAPDSDASEAVLMELADTYLLTKNFEKAQQMYKLYIQLYPGGTERITARFKEIESYYQALQPAENDQTESRKTIELISKFAMDFPDEIDSLKRLLPYLKKALSRLIESELIVVRNYLNRTMLAPVDPAPLHAAKKRLIYIQEKLLPDLERIDRKAYELDEIITSITPEDVPASQLTKAYNKMLKIIQTPEAYHPRDTF